MIDLLVAAALTSGSPATALLQPPLDTPQERQALRKLTNCVAELRPRWARRMLAYPYLSSDQARVASELVSGHDRCLGAPEVAVAFRNSSVVGFAAEHFIQSDMAGIDPQRVGNALNTVAPKNVSEDFALCLAARDPTAALNLTRSEPGSAGEATAAGQVAMGLAYCSKPGERMTIDVQALRALVATALYRAVSASISIK